MTYKMFLIVLIAIGFAIVINACSHVEYKTDNKPDSLSYYKNGLAVRKIRVDSIDYVVVTNYQSGISIIKHSK